jgi:hypothetical protein
MRQRKYVFFVAIAMAISSCDNSLDIRLPNSKITVDQAFADDASANAAMIGVYIDMYDATSFSSGSNRSFQTLAGLSADELMNGPKDQAYLDFEDSQISVSNSLVLSLWKSMYKTIYDANSVLEGVAQSKSLTDETKDRLTGEALTIRAFTYFYLVNSYGDVPLVTSTNYLHNADLKRETATTVYEQIKSDLQSAEDLLPKTYETSNRVRVVGWAATALLSRVYLFTSDWARAEDKATKVIANNALFSLEPNLNDVFLIGSKEAIFQLKPPDGNPFTNEGSVFGPQDGPSNNVMRPSFVDSFNDNDLRKTNWIAKLNSQSGVTYLPNKYKKYQLGTPTTEYSMVMRLTELFLIRAEARARQNKLAEAIADIDRIRLRAGLTLIKESNPQISSDELLLLIDEERKFELFTEWGHRWLDLKRRNRVGEILVQIKPNWIEKDNLYPIPQSEILKNIKLLPQNEGY